MSFAVNTGVTISYQPSLSKLNYERTLINNHILTLLDKKTELSSKKSKAYSGKSIKINYNSKSSNLTWDIIKEYNNNSSNSPIQLYNTSTGKEILEGNQDDSSISGDIIFRDDDDGSILQANLLRGTYAFKDMNGNTVNLEDSDIFTLSAYTDKELASILSGIEAEENRIEQQEQEYELRLNKIETDISYLEKTIQSVEKRNENDNSKAEKTAVSEKGEKRSHKENC